ncbi:MAG: aspartate aminotransferase family protein [Lachnospiraceae bacterium]|jgi:acetylornithine/N-succinyldiaminopimelate aminotransferase|nr:aspartate aminotransferase family protein [Lachnospiraceae bacterium]
MMEKDNKTYIELAENHIFHLVNRFPIVIERGEGCHLIDVEGRRYLDFFAGIAVCSLGYGNQAYLDALKEQVERITHTSNWVYNRPAITAAERLTQLSGMARVFFTNSGAEAVEGAIKTARKYAYQKKGAGKHGIIAMEAGFHGRTMGALSVTGTTAYRTPFEPMIGHVRFAEMNNYDSILKHVDEDTCAIIVETVQGEGGIHPADGDFLRKVGKLCQEKGILLIIDEIQCGIGRTGTMFAYQQYEIEPDILVLGKALSNGIPVGAFLVSDDVAQNSLVPGDHGTTYGGNPLAMAAVNAVLEQIEEMNLIDRVSQLAAYLTEKLEQMVAKHDFVVSRRGLGLMQGIECSGDVTPILKEALARGLLIISAGANVIRLIPPLIVTMNEIDEMIEILDRALCLGTDNEDT